MFSDDSNIYATDDKADDDGDKESSPSTSDVGEMSIDVEHSQGVDDEHGDGNLDDSDARGSQEV